MTLRVGERCGTFYVHDTAALEMLKSFGGEEHLLSLLLSLLRSGDTLYDIGAEQGIYTVFGAQAVGVEGDVVAFEPEGARFDRLRNNVKLNRLTNVQAFRQALSDRSGQAELAPSQIGRAPMLEAIGSKCRRGGRQRVEIAPGDILVKEKKLPLPTAVKIDVEGHELSVLRGLRDTLSNAACRVVFCEVHPWLLPTGAVPTDAIGLLRSFGFSRVDTFLRPPDQHMVAYKDSRSSLHSQ